MDDSKRIGPENLWAPWRVEYIKRSNPPAGCVFCALPEEADDSVSLIVHRGRTAYVVMNRFPYNNGHVMVVPYRHLHDFCELSDEETLEMMTLAKITQHVMKSVMNAQGFNMGMNLGSAAGAGIADHLHLHVVPRWNGDTNFMPIIGGTKVISEALHKTWEQLAASFSDFIDNEKPPVQM